MCFATCCYPLRFFLLQKSKTCKKQRQAYFFMKNNVHVGLIFQCSFHVGTFFVFGEKNIHPSLNWPCQKNKRRTKKFMVNKAQNSTGTRKKKKEYTFEEVAQHFELPIKEASENLNVSLTQLKRICRTLDIPKWPCMFFENFFLI